MLKPRVGMPILFKVPDDARALAGQPFFSATVVAAHKDGTVNLTVFDQNGLDYPVQNAVVVQAEGGNEAYCVTPPAIDTRPNEVSPEDDCEKDEGCQTG